MLVLSLKPGEWLHIGDKVRIRLERKTRDGASARVAIDAPKEVRVLRESVLEKHDEAPAPAAIVR